MQKKDSVSLRNRINATVRDIPRSGIRDFFDIVSTMNDVISLGIGEPDFDTPWHVRESTMFALERGVTWRSSRARVRRKPSAALVVTVRGTPWAKRIVARSET